MLTAHGGREASLADLLTAPHGSPFVLLAGPADSDRHARQLAAVDGLDELATVPPGTLVLVPGHCVANLATYELDVAVRLASDRGAAGIVLIGVDRLPITVKQIAGRSGLGVFGTRAVTSVVDLVRQLDRIMGRADAAVLERATSLVAWARETRDLDDHLQLIGEAEARLGTELRAWWLGPGRDDAEPVIVGGSTVGWIAGTSREDRAARLALPAIASAVGRCYERRILGEETAGDTVANLIAAPAANRTPLAEQARAAGVDLDARYLVVHICSSQGSDPAETGGLVTQRRRRVLTTVALREHLGYRAPSWLVTRIENDVGLVWTDAAEVDPGRAATAAEQVMRLLRDQDPGTQFCAGVGSAGWGVDGLCRSAIEAHAAARSAAAQGLDGRALHIGGSQLEQLLSELATSSVAHRVIDDVLAPLDALPDHARFTAIQTLGTYLGMQGSRARAATVLHLHPNGVGHRVRKAVELLDVDLTDPDTRLVMQLACRVWLMAHQRA